MCFWPMYKFFSVILVATFLLSGCAEENSASHEREDGIVDYVTGVDKIKVYKKTKSKIEGINESLKERYEGLE